jgi:hypothetical protein
VLVSLVVAFTFGALAATSASAAQPAFRGSFPDKFTITGSTPTLETVGKRRIVCAPPFGSLKGEGEITGAKTATATLTLSVCRGFNNGCTTIKTPELEGKPVYVNAKREVGIVFQRKGAGNFLEFSCGTGTEKETVKVRGAVIATVIPLNVEAKTFRLTLNEEGGVQKPTEYENEAKEKVKAILETEGSGKEAFAFEQTGLAGGTLVATPLTTIFTTTTATMIEGELSSKGKPEFRKGLEFGRPVKFDLFSANGSPTFSTEINQWFFSTSSISGWITGPNEVAGVVITLGEGSTAACYTSGKSYVTNELIGRLGYINKAEKTVGLLLEPTVQPIAKCLFRANYYEHLGSVIGAFRSVVGQRTKTFDFRFRQEGLVNKPEKFEGEQVAHDLEWTSEGPGAKKLGFEWEPVLGLPEEMSIEA